MPIDVHGSSDLLQRFVLGELTGELRDAVVRELAGCADCRAIVGALSKNQRVSPVIEVPSTHVATVPKERLRAPGAVVGGRYRVEAVLGEGGMGVVYRVVHDLLGRRFALKMLLPERAGVADAVRRFLAEARLLASLGHEGVVDVVDLGHDGDSPFLVMELLEGETLHQRLARGPLPLEQGIDVALRLADALAVAHARGIIHRDVKPPNVFLRPEPLERGWVKLLDFGLAKLRASETERDVDRVATHTGAILGTPRYMAPEQWRGDKSIDARADVFAWGVTVHQALTGQLPFRPAEVFAAPDFGARPDVRASRPEVPLEIARIIEEALSIDRAARPADGGEVARRLRDAQAALAPARFNSQRPRSVSPPREQASVSSSSHPIVGREAALDALSARVRARGRPLVLVGPEGVGKSALLFALIQRLESTPDSVHGALTILHAEPSREAAAPFASLRHLTAASTTLTSVERALKERLFGTLALDTVIIAGDPAALDPESRRLLLELGRGVGAFVIGEARTPEGASALEADAWPVEGLDRAGLDALARTLGVSLSTIELDRLAALTGGHPLFALQCLALREERTSGIDAIPLALEDAILARLDAAPTGAAHAWQVAAVLRRQVTPADLLALGVSEAAFGLDWLTQRGVLVRRGGYHELAAGIYADVAERALPPDLAAALHRSAAALRTRQLGPESPRGAWARIGHHHARGGELALASDAYARATLGEAAQCVFGVGVFGGGAPLGGVLGGGALGGGDGEAHVVPAAKGEDVGFRVRAAWAEEALNLAVRAQRVRLDEVELRLVLVERLEGEGRFDEAAQAALELESASPTPDQLARALVRRGAYLQRLARHDEALDCFLRAEVAARSGGTEDTLATALGRHAVCLALAGQLAEARDRLLAAEELVLRSVPSRRADLAGWKAQIAAFGGDLGARRDAYWAAVELFRAEGNHRFAAFSLLNLGGTYLSLGAYDEAERALAEAYAECGALGATTMAGYAALNWGTTLARLGRPEIAKARLDEAADVARRTEDQRLSAYTALYRARFALERRDVDAAQRIEELMGRLEEDALRDPAWRASALAALAEWLLRAGDLEGALHRAREAEAIRDEAGALEEGEAEVALVLSDSLRALGHHAEADRALKDGARRLKQTAQRIAGAHWRACFTVDVPNHRRLLEAGSVTASPGAR